MFKNLSLKYKLLLIVVPMALALLGTSYFIIHHYSSEKEQFDGLTQVTDSFDDTGKLITCLQIERFKSDSFYMKETTLDELNLHRKDCTDIQVIELRKMLTLIPFQPEDSKVITENLDSIIALRKQINNHSIKVEDMSDNFAAIIEKLLIAEGQASLIYKGGGIENVLSDITILESMKEAMTMARGDFSNVFEKDLPISSQQVTEFEESRIGVKIISESPALELLESMHKKIHEILSSSNWLSLEKDMDQVVAKYTKGGYGVNAKNFIERINISIKDVGDIVEKERVALVSQAEEGAAHAQKIFRFTIIAVILCLAALILFAVMIIKNIVAQEEQIRISSMNALRSSSMVESSPVATMMCDPAGQIIYINQSASETLKNLKAHLPDISAGVIGKSIDIFHKNPAVQLKIISDPRNLPHKAVFAVGPEKLDILVTANIDPEGKYLGAALTWTVVTAKVELIRDLTKSAEDLAHAATDVLSISTNLSASAEETSAQANTASVASEEVNAGVQTVASNMEEMVSAIKEITKTTNEAASMTNEAMRITKNTNIIINKLGESSMDIGNVIKVISSIAQQTNLLALNATIEAARAGEAGKGFAVVANEVKELANQTAKATNEITKKIETIQSDSKSAVDAIAEITQAIEKVNGFTGNIAASVEEQAATTNEVTRIVTEAAEGVKQISENIGQVSQAAASTGKDAGNAHTAARGVGETAELLKKYVARLKVE
jgi:methyl-accepting chemotaxis protein